MMQRWPVTLAAMQRYLHTIARGRGEAIAAPPFTIFVQRDDAEALPAGPIDEGIDAALVSLRAAFAARGRRPRVTFLEEFAPALGLALIAAGFVLDERQDLLACLPEDLVVAPAVPGARLLMLDESADVADIEVNLETNERGFDPLAASVTRDDAIAFRRELIAGRAFTVLADETAVAAGMINPIIDGIAQLVGITTLAPYRWRGYAAWLTSRMTAEAFAMGARMVVLSTTNPEAHRLYLRLGYRSFAQQVRYHL